MGKRKLMFYGAIILALVLIWGVFFVITSSSIERASIKQLEQFSANALEQSELQLIHMSKDMQLSAGSYAHMQLDSYEQLKPLLLELGDEYYVLDPSGMLYDKNGVVNLAPLTPYALLAHQQGHAVAPQGGERVLLITPLGVGGFCIARRYDIAQFYIPLMEDLHAGANAMILFDEYGNVLSTLRSDDDEQLINSLTNAVREYRAGRMETIQNVSLLGGYNLLVPLDQPDGWLMAFRMPISAILPLYTTIIGLCLLAMGLVFALIGIVFAMDYISSKNWLRDVKRGEGRDALTQLNTSSSTEQALVGFARRNDIKRYSFVCMDIAAFHRFNTMFSHSTGDALLRVVADVIRDNYHCGARAHGDIFTFLIPTSEYIVEEIENAMYARVRSELGGQYLQMVSFKFGIYPLSNAQLNFRDIFDGASLALRDAKRSAKQNDVVFDLELQQMANMQKNIEINMLHALASEEYVVYVQPKFDVASGHCIGGETLVRWDSGQMGFLSPVDFIPIFESNGFIVEIDFYMMERALMMLSRWQSAGLPMLNLSVNLSRVSINFPNYLERMQSLVARYDVPLQHIEIEITESIFEENYDAMVAMVGDIRNLGFAVSIDDFGTGYSSLNTLRDLPVDVLKIDREFLLKTDGSERSRTVVRTIIDMAHNLSMHVVCEGVETPQQLAFLKQAECDCVQGYYLARPMPAAQFEHEYVGTIKEDQSAF